MAAQKGRDALIKIGDGGSPTETFSTLAGIRTRTLTVNRETVDVSNSDSVLMFRELLADAGIRSVSISGNGVFKNATQAGLIINHMLSGTELRNFQILFPGLGTFAGAFDVTTCEFAGEYNGELTYSLSLESAAVITFVAA